MGFVFNEKAKTRIPKDHPGWQLPAIVFWILLRQILYYPLFAR